MSRIVKKIIQFFNDKITGNGLDQSLNSQGEINPLKNENVIPLARQAAGEGIVLLKNENNALPFKTDDNIAVFGRCAINYFGVGYGSGGDIVRPYLSSLMDGLFESGVTVNMDLYNKYKTWVDLPKNEIFDGVWGHWPMNYPEMPLDLETVKNASKQSNVAVVVIGRAAGEDRENILEKGSFYLTDLEQDMLKKVTSCFDRVVVIMDCGNVVDMSWLNEYGDKISAVVYAWQGGMESGNALADVLTGKVSPSGKLTDTIAVAYDKYPSASNFGNDKFNNYAEDIYVGYRYFETFKKSDVLYPFGFGLSYTTFDYNTSVSADKTKISLSVNVKNTGNVKGKEVIQVYLGLPQGVLDNPEKVLASFAKTKELLPQEEQTLELTFDICDFAPYDDAGKTGYEFANVLEKGDYKVYVGTSVRDSKEVYTYTQENTICVKKLSQHLAVEPKNAFDRMVNKNGKISYEKTPVSRLDLKKLITDNLPKGVEFTGDKGIKLADVKNGKNTMEEFIAQLSPQELDDISHGEGEMDSSFGAKGNAGALAGITKSLRDKGIPPVITCDGPSGIRIRHTTALIPCGTALASSFNTELVENLYAEISKEMDAHGVNILLAPGMNIHRNVLCGRNFEYYSEDPLVSGKIASAAVRGIQSCNTSACPKHFACNNQEKKRNVNDSRVSERALREIYLKGFEIMVNESNPDIIMTSYNRINGVYSHYNYELVTSVLREEWGFKGLIITDWWMAKEKSHEFPKLKNDAYRVRAQVDVLMPGGNGYKPITKVGRTLLDTYGKANGITLGEMQRCAVNVLNLAMKYLK